MTTLAQRIEQERSRCQMTQEALADKAKVSQGLIHKLESGKAKESRKLSQIAAALGVDTDWLSTGQGNKFKSSRPDGWTNLAGVNDKDHPPYRSASHFEASSNTQIIRTPFINWSEFCGNTNSINKKELDFMMIDKEVKASEEIYAVDVDTNTFRDFPPGTRILIDPKQTPEKNRVVMLSIDDGIPTLARWNPGLGQLQIEPLESGYPNSISLDGKTYVIHGVAIWYHHKGGRL